MTLPASPHYKYMAAVKAALEDARSEVGLTWRIQKLATQRGAKWNAGAYLVPLIGFEPSGYENATDLVKLRTLAVIVSPSELSLTSDMESELQRVERVEAIFRNSTPGKGPASLSALNSISPDPLWRYQITRLEPADRFLAQAFGVGYDASGVVLAADFTLARSRFDFTALGGP